MKRLRPQSAAEKCFVTQQTFELLALRLPQVHDVESSPLSHIIKKTIRRIAMQLVLADSCGALSITNAAIHFTSPSSIILRIYSVVPISIQSEVYLNFIHDFQISISSRSDKTLKVLLNSLEDQQTLHAELEHSGGIAFVMNGSILPLMTSINPASNYNYGSDFSESNMFLQHIPFESPPSLEHSFTLPHAGTIKGMLIPPGVIVIAGGGYHGKSTLLNALKRGTQFKLPGDGCEFVTSLSGTFSLRSEEGRPVGGIDISPFISSLPSNAGIDPRLFRTSHASGSTSMATNTIELLELDARVFLLDEDSCATNFIVRDSRMRALVVHESITPFIYRVNALYRQCDVSTIVIAGGIGDWLDVQTCTLLIDNYKVKDVSKRAASIINSFCTGRVQFNGRGLVHQLPWPAEYPPCNRYLDLNSVRETFGVSFNLNVRTGRSVTFEHLYLQQNNIASVSHRINSINSSGDGRTLTVGNYTIDMEHCQSFQTCIENTLGLGWVTVYILLKLLVQSEVTSNSNPPPIISATDKVGRQLEVVEHPSNIKESLRFVSIASLIQIYRDILSQVEAIEATLTYSLSSLQSTLDAGELTSNLDESKVEVNWQASLARHVLRLRKDYPNLQQVDYSDEINGSQLKPSLRNSRNNISSECCSVDHSYDTLETLSNTFDTIKNNWNISGVVHAQHLPAFIHVINRLPGTRFNYDNS